LVHGKIAVRGDYRKRNVMPSKVSFEYQDYSRERSKVGFNIVTLTAANFDATISAVNSLSSAILAVQKENALQSKKVMAQDTLVSRSPASDKASQRETKWLVTLEDATLHSLSRHEIPMADTQWVTANSDFADLSASPFDDLKTAIEATVKSPAGNSVLMVSAQLVGKRI
jgi:hypothetical protein